MVLYILICFKARLAVFSRSADTTMQTVSNQPKEKPKAVQVFGRKVIYIFRPLMCYRKQQQLSLTVNSGLEPSE